jgi:hypothetical protein
MRVVVARHTRARQALSPETVPRSLRATDNPSRQAANALQPVGKSQHTLTPDAKVGGTITASPLVSGRPCLFSTPAAAARQGFKWLGWAGLGSAPPVGSGGWSCPRRRRSPCTSAQSGGTAGSGIRVVHPGRSWVGRNDQGMLNAWNVRGVVWFRNVGGLCQIAGSTRRAGGHHRPRDPTHHRRGHQQHRRRQAGGHQQAQRTAGNQASSSREVGDPLHHAVHQRAVHGGAAGMSSWPPCCSSWESSP